MASTANGKGPFAASGPDERLLLAQTLVAVAGTTSLVLAALTSQHVRAERAMREHRRDAAGEPAAARLPTVPKIETSAYFRPAGAGHRVGGDFYDLFQAGHGGWALVVGDVVGKGPGAAALTALARYTLRTAAESERAAKSGPGRAQRCGTPRAQQHGAVHRRLRDARCQRLAEDDRVERRPSAAAGPALRR